MGERRNFSKWILVGQTDVAKRRVIALKFGENTVGKRRRDHVRIASDLCSRQHCQLLVDDHEDISLRDHSTNGTYVNGRRLNLGSLKLEVGHIIGFGSRTFDIDPGDARRYVYRLDRRDDTIVETIDLISDDDNEAADSGESEDSADVSQNHGGHERGSEAEGSALRDARRRVKQQLEKKKAIADAKIIAAKPLRTRRRTIVEMDDDSGGEAARCAAAKRSAHGRSETAAASGGGEDRAARLAQLGEKERQAREEAQRIAAAKRVRAVPKVKKTLLTRNEKLAWDLARACAGKNDG